MKLSTGGFNPLRNFFLIFLLMGSFGGMHAGEGALAIKFLQSLHWYIKDPEVDMPLATIRYADLEGVSPELRAKLTRLGKLIESKASLKEIVSLFGELFQAGIPREDSEVVKRYTDWLEKIVESRTYEEFFRINRFLESLHEHLENPKVTINYGSLTGVSFDLGDNLRNLGILISMKASVAEIMASLDEIERTGILEGSGESIVRWRYSLLLWLKKIRAMVLSKEGQWKREKAASEAYWKAVRSAGKVVLDFVKNLHVYVEDTGVEIKYGDLRMGPSDARLTVLGQMIEKNAPHEEIFRRIDDIISFFPIVLKSQEEKRSFDLSSQLLKDLKRKIIQKAGLERPVTPPLERAAQRAQIERLTEERRAAREKLLEEEARGEIAVLPPPTIPLRRRKVPSRRPSAAESEAIRAQRAAREKLSEEAARHALRQRKKAPTPPRRPSAAEFEAIRAQRAVQEKLLEEAARGEIAVLPPPTIPLRWRKVPSPPLAPSMEGLAMKAVKQAKRRVVERATTPGRAGLLLQIRGFRKKQLRKAAEERGKLPKEAIAPLLQKIKEEMEKVDDMSTKEKFAYMTIWERLSTLERWQLVDFVSRQVSEEFQEALVDAEAQLLLRAEKSVRREQAVRRLSMVGFEFLEEQYKKPRAISAPPRREAPSMEGLKMTRRPRSVSPEKKRLLEAIRGFKKEALKAPEEIVPLVPEEIVPLVPEEIDEFLLKIKNDSRFWGDLSHERRKQLLSVVASDKKYESFQAILVAAEKLDLENKLELARDRQQMTLLRVKLSKLGVDGFDYLAAGLYGIKGVEEEKGPEEEEGEW